MTGKAGRSGRPRGETKKVALQARVTPEEAAAFEKLVERRAAAAAAVGHEASAASVLRAIIRKELIAEGLLSEPKKTKAA